jgi:hypothetical protein
MVGYPKEVDRPQVCRGGGWLPAYVLLEGTTHKRHNSRQRVFFEVR